MVSTRAKKRREGGATDAAPKVDYNRDPLKEYLSDDDSADDKPLRFTNHGRIHSVEVKPDGIKADRPEAPAQQGFRPLAIRPMNQVADFQPQPLGGPFQNNNQTFHYHAEGPQIPFDSAQSSIYPNMANAADAHSGPWASGPAGPADPAAPQGFAPFNDGLQPMSDAMILPSMPQEAPAHGLADSQGYVPGPSNGPNQPFFGYDQGPGGGQLSAGHVSPSNSASTSNNAKKGVKPQEIALNGNPPPNASDFLYQDLFLDSAYTVDSLIKIQLIAERYPMEMRPMNAYDTVMQVFLARSLSERGLVPVYYPFRINRSLLMRVNLSRPVDQCMVYEGRWLPGGPQGPGWYKNGTLRSTNSEYGINMLAVLQFNQNEFLRRLDAAEDAEA